MALILVYSVPLWGHTYPLLGVAEELAARGHEVLLHCGENHGKLARDCLGRSAVAIAALEALRSGGTPTDWSRCGESMLSYLAVAATEAENLYPAVHAALARRFPRAVLADELALGARWAAEPLGIPQG